MAGLMLLVLFLSIEASAFFPLVLLDPTWQLNVVDSLLNTAPVSLTGLALLHLGSSLDRQDHLLLNRRELASRLAVQATLGFLLLIPLLCSATLMQSTTISEQRSATLGRVSMQLDRMQLAVKQASSVDDLEQRLRAINGPRLEPADRALPLPQVKARVVAVLDLASREISTRMSPVKPADLNNALAEILRKTLASLSLSIAFAGLARRRGSQTSLLIEAFGGGKQRRAMEVNNAQPPRA